MIGRGGEQISVHGRGESDRSGEAEFLTRAGLSNLRAEGIGQSRPGVRTKAPKSGDDFLPMWDKAGSARVSGPTTVQKLLSHTAFYRSDLPNEFLVTQLRSSGKPRLPDRMQEKGSNFETYGVSLELSRGVLLYR